MKKNFFCFCIAALPFFAFSQTSAESLCGEWANPHRKIEISEDEIQVSFLSFYGKFEEKPIKRKSKIELSNSSLEITVFLDEKERRQTIPVAVSKENLFLDFCVKGSAFSPENHAPNSVLGYWRPASNISEIGVAEQTPKKELTGFYFSEDEMFLIRYWRTDADYESVQATFQIGEKLIPVDKFLEIGGCVYTCVHGQGAQIRNIQKSRCKIDGETLHLLDADKFQDVYMASDFSFLAMSKPYMSRKDKTLKN